ncbi:MAG: DUF1109 family protein [Acidobacteria bacterium]|nr:DUF1109 family protein [Acidobacteriota bacterium]
MSPDRSRLPDPLRATIARDLRPVRPEPVPFRRVLHVVPLALLTVLAIVGVIGLRPDLPQFGPLAGWGASLVEGAAATALIWMAAREGTLTHRLPRTVVVGALAGSTSLVIAMALWTDALRPTVVPVSLTAWRVGLFCGVAGTLVGALLVGAVAWMSRRSLIAHPALTGALYGAGAGVVVNAGWRLACPISSPWHTLAAHGSAILATTALGVATACLVAMPARRASKR